MAVAQEDAASLRRRYLARYIGLFLAFDKGEINEQVLDQRVRNFLADLALTMPALRRDILSDPVLIKAIHERHIPVKI